MFERLELPPRPKMTGSQDDRAYAIAVHEAALVLRAAQPWLLLPYSMSELWVARRRTAFMWLVVLVVNLWRRPRRWWLGRMQLAREARYFKTGNRS